MRATMAGMHSRLKHHRLETLRLLLLLMVSTVPIEIVSANLPIANQQQVATLAITEETTWARQLVQVSDRPLNARLLLKSKGIVTVYFNGQRLARSTSTEDRVLVWSVSELIRNGTNCIAVVVHGSSESLNDVAAWIDSPEAFSSQPVPWKSTTSSPPIGWQQTDFNDRDWQASTKGTPLDPAAVLSSEPKQMGWKVDSAATRFGEDGFRFRDGDHVVLLGGTFIERAQNFGYLESLLSLGTRDAHVTFRNLGWSADTVFAESRGIFDSPSKGYERMIEHVRAEEPTVIFLCYGQNEAMDDPKGTNGIESFKQQLKRLYSDLKPTGAEFVFLSPHPFIETAPPLPDASRWNPRLQEYSDAVNAVADSLNAPFIDLFTNFLNGVPKSGFHEALAAVPVDDRTTHPELSRAQWQSWTDNGIHWNELGYAKVASYLSDQVFGQPAVGPAVEVDYVDKTIQATTGKIRNIQWSQNNRFDVQFEYQAETLSLRPLVVQLNGIAIGAQNGLNVSIADNSKPPLFLKNVASPFDESLRYSSAQNLQFENVRQLTIKKNELYFHRWRPQNITYLFGFRKHEQGNNAVEIAQFDPLVDELEKQIHDARRPMWQTINIVKSDEQ